MRQHVSSSVEGADVHERKLPPQLPRARDGTVGEELSARQPRRQTSHRVPVRQGTYYILYVFPIHFHTIVFSFSKCPFCFEGFHQYFVFRRLEHVSHGHTLQHTPCAAAARYARKTLLGRKVGEPYVRPSLACSRAWSQENCRFCIRLWPPRCC